MRPCPAVIELTDSRLSGVYALAPERVADLLRQASTAQVHVARINLLACHHKAELLDAIANALDFPAWFGHNWDALSDCLADLDWLPAAGHVLLFEHTEHFRRAHAGQFATLQAVLDDACAAATAAARPLFAFIVVNEAGTAAGTMRP